MGFEQDSKRGVLQHYGPRVTNQKYGAESKSDGVVREKSWTFSYDDLPAAGTNEIIASLPAGSIPVEAYFQVIEAFDGGTSYDIDFVDSSDTAIGSGEDKLWDALALAQIDASEVSTALLASTHTGTNSGNALNTKLASAGQLKVAATGSFTAGKAKITVRYLQVPAS